MKSRLLRELVTLPNLMSVSRIGLVYLSAWLVLVDWPLTGLAIAVMAGLTDYLDGYLARRLQQVTELGAILDRLSDLVFESSWLVVAIMLRDLPPVVILLYLFREFVVLSARLYCSAHGVTVHSTFIGKLKSNFLGYAAFLLYASHAPTLALVRLPIEILFVVGISGGLFLSYWSAYDYLKVFARAYNQPQ